MRGGAYAPPLAELSRSSWTISAAHMSTLFPYCEVVHTSRQAPVPCAPRFSPSAQSTSCNLSMSTLFHYCELVHTSRQAGVYDSFAAESVRVRG